MPVPSQYRRAPLMGMALTPINDNAIRWDSELVKRLLARVDPDAATSLQCVYATILGGYDTAPGQPDLDGIDPLADPLSYAEDLAAAEMIAIMSRDMEEVNYFREKLALWNQAMESMDEGAIFDTGKIMLRTLADFYARTGDKLCLEMAERYRSYLPDVSSFLSTFPFQSAYTPDAGSDAEFSARMGRFAAHPCAALSMCAALCRFTGSKTAWEAIGKGFDALYRYHGLPGGVLSQHPYVAGRDPAGRASTEAVCELITALCDALLLTGETRYAERLEAILRNALPELIREEGVQTGLTPSRLQGESTVLPEGAMLTGLLEALVSLRRCILTRSEDNTVEVMLHQKAEALLRLPEGSARISVDGRGFCRRVLTVKTECKDSLRFRLRIRVPALPDGARLLLNGSDPQICPVNQLALIERTFHSGDTIELQTTYSPRCEGGYRGGLSVYCGETLLALPLPSAGSEYRYALVADAPMSADTFEGQHCVIANAVPAPNWSLGTGRVLPPPQDTVKGEEELELILLPASGLNGRITLLPVAR